MSDQTRYDEFHQNMEEFWEYAGKAKSKRRKSAAVKRRSVANETVKALSTASAVVVTFVVTMILYVTCLPISIQSHSADIHVQMYDWVDETVYYSLQQVDSDALVAVEDGVLQESEQLLHFENLQDDQSYLLEFFTIQQDGQPLYVGKYEFKTTASEKTTPTVVAVSGNANLVGRSMRDGEFHFVLTQNGQTIQTVTNDISGEFGFALPFEASGTYTYTVSQVMDSAPGVTYDTASFDITVVVTDVNGQLQAKVESGKIHFTNTYTPTPVSTTFSGNIQLSGRTMLANEFTFAVANGGQVIQTVTNNADGRFTFNLTFTAAGTYTYTVYQIAGSNAQITYDTNTFTQTYIVTDTNGVLSLQEKTTQAIFSNIHTPAPINVNINGIVTLDGATLTADQFTFVLREGNTILGQTTNAADGSILFTQTLSAAGTYVYTITQQANSNAEMGLRQDLDPLQVVVTVTDRNGQLSATQEYNRQEKPVYALEFWNIYEDLYATANLYGSASLNDVTNNSIMSPVTNRFRFGLYQNGKLVSEIGNGSDGSFYFPELIFRQVGTYQYTVRQIPGRESWIQYDTREYSVTVTVTYEYGDPMAVIDMYDSSGQYAQTLDFINNYTPPAQTYTFTIPDSPGSGYAIYVYDETGMQSGTTTARPGMIVEFYVMVPISTTEINLQVTCNIPGMIAEQVYRYGNEIRFQFVMPAQNVLPENIILTVI